MLRAIGLTEGQIRGGAVAGDSRRMGWDSLLAKSDTEAGRKMKQQMELESDKLREYGDDIVKSTGGTVGAAPEVRGAAILKPLEAYKDWYKNQIKQLYEQADKKAKSTGGIELVDFQAKLRENSFFASRWDASTAQRYCFVDARARFGWRGWLFPANVSKAS